MMSIDKDNSPSDVNFTSSNLKITLDKSTFQIKRAQSLQSTEKFWTEEAKNLVRNRQWDKT